MEFPFVSKLTVLTHFVRSNETTLAPITGFKKRCSIDGFLGSRQLGMRPHEVHTLRLLQRWCCYLEKSLSGPSWWWGIGNTPGMVMGEWRRFLTSHIITAVEVME